MLPTGIAVSIITFGYNTSLGRKLMKVMKDNPDSFYTPIDIRKQMPRDPLGEHRLYKVYNNENADYSRTQAALLNDTRFYGAVLHLVNKVEEFATAEDSGKK